MSDLRFTRLGWVVMVIVVLLLAWGLGALADAIVDPTPLILETTTSDWRR